MWVRHDQRVFIELRWIFAINSSGLEDFHHPLLNAEKQQHSPRSPGADIQGHPEFKDALHLQGCVLCVMSLTM